MMNQKINEDALETDQRRNTDTVAGIGTQYTPEVLNNNAGNEKLCELSDKLTEFVQSRANCTPGSTEGYAAEIHHKYTFEADAARKGLKDIEVKIGPRGGRGSKGTADLVVHKNGEPVTEAGLKYRSKAGNTAFDQSNVNDHGRQKVCPADQVERVKELSNARAKTNALKSGEYADTAANATDRIKYDGAESAPLTRKGAQEICENPGNF